jgi:endonuclease YncB( thermonuclease family)
MKKEKKNKIDRSNFKLDPYTFKVESVNNIVDGDTVDLTLDLGFSIKLEHRFRMMDYDAPETWRPKCDAEEIAGEKVKLFLQETLERYKETLYIRSCKLGIYGRYEGLLLTFIDEQEHDINAEINNYIIENHLTKEEVRAKK